MAQNKIVSIVENAIKNANKQKKNTPKQTARTTRQTVSSTKKSQNTSNFVKKAKPVLQKAINEIKKVPGFKQVIEINDTYRPLTLPTRIYWFMAKKDRMIVDQKWRQSFYDNYTKTGTYEWVNDYCNRKQNSPNLSKILKRVSKLNYKPSIKFRKIPYNKDEVNAHVLSFYNDYFQPRYKEAKSILEGTHPLFIDKNGVSHVHYDGTNLDNNTLGHVNRVVSNKTTGPYLEFSIMPQDSFFAQITTAHELAHALSEGAFGIVSAARKGIKYPDKTYDQDAKFEIESLIVEKLYVEYALKHKLITKREYRSIKNSDHNYIVRNARRLRHQEEIGLRLGKNPTQKQLDDYIEELNGNKNIKVIDRINSLKNYDQENSPSWYNRYFVGQVVAEVWMDKFEHSTKRERRAMLNNFSDYLLTNDRASLDDACSFLLGKDFSSVVDDYVSMRQKESIIEKARDFVHTKKEYTKHVIRSI